MLALKCHKFVKAQLWRDQFNEIPQAKISVVNRCLRHCSHIIIIKPGKFLLVSTANLCENLKTSNNRIRRKFLPSCEKLSTEMTAFRPKISPSKNCSQIIEISRAIKF